jgi:dCMP deaminase
VNWLEWHMAHAELAAKKSKDTTQVGAALIGPQREVILTAFNGPPIGVLDSLDRRQRPTKYLFASHAEQNLVAFAARRGIRTEGCKVFVTHCPCAACAKSLIQAGVAAVTYGAGSTSMPQDEFEAALTMFKEAGVRVHQYAATEV